MHEPAFAAGSIPRTPEKSQVFTKKEGGRNCPLRLVTMGSSGNGLSLSRWFGIVHFFFCVGSDMTVVDELRSRGEVERAVVTRTDVKPLHIVPQRKNTALYWAA